MKAEVTRFEKFIHENDSKRARAEQRTKMERAERLQKERRIEELEKQLSDIKKSNEELIGDSDKLRVYQRFLEQVVETSPADFDERDEVINRHRTLSDAHAQLKASVDDNDAKMDGERNDIAQMRRDMQNAVLVQNSEVHVAQKQLETLRSDAIKADMSREKAEREMKARSSEAGQVTMSIKNLYMRCLQTMHGKFKPLSEDEMSPADYMCEALGEVCDRVLDLKDVASGYGEYVRRKDEGALDEDSAEVTADGTRDGDSGLFQAPDSV